MPLQFLPESPPNFVAKIVRKAEKPNNYLSQTENEKVNSTLFKSIYRAHLIGQILIYKSNAL